MRKTLNYKVEDKNRDHGKCFFITEKSCDASEDWALRVFLALIANNVSVPDNYADLGMAGLAEMGFKAFSQLNIEQIRPLLAEMMECVQIIPDPKVMQKMRPLVSDDIEEVSTKVKLRAATFGLHVDFSMADVRSIFPAVKQGATVGHGRVTATSQKR